MIYQIIARYTLFRLLSTVFSAVVEYWLLREAIKR